MGNKSAKLEQKSGPIGDKSSSVSSLFKARFKMCPTKHRKAFMRDQKNSLNNRPQLPLPKESTKNEKENEWTEVLLQVPSSPPSEIRKEQSMPHAPPRKHRQSTPGPEKAHHYEQVDAQPEDSTDKIPVQEEIIVPKKEPIHICDGTHRHCINIVNGKVIQSTVSKNSSNPSNKTTSSSSLPNHEDLLGKYENIQKQKNRSSHSSLSSEKIPKYLNSEKLESFITRWKSFGSIIPSNEKVAKNSTNVENRVPSEESWDGTDRWAENVIESNTIEHIVPAARKRSRGTSKTDMAKKKIPNSPILDKNHYSTDTISLNSGMDVSTHVNTKSIGGMCEDLKMFPFKARNSGNVFESDTFYTTEFLKRENEASSLQLQAYTNKPTNARRCTFKDDTDKVDERVANDEMDGMEAPEMVKNTEMVVKNDDKDRDKILLEKNNDSSCEFDKMTPKIMEKNTNLVKKTKEDEDSDELLATLQDFCDTFDKKNCIGEKKSNVESNYAKKGERPQVTPRRKSGIGHSNLLRILQQNSPTTKPSTVSLDKGMEEGSKILEFGSQDKMKRLESDFTDVDEPKITPELKSIESSWQQLLKRDHEDSLSNVTEFESAISELPDNSSLSEDDYKSITLSKDLYSRN